MLRVTKDDVRDAYKYYGLFYTRPDRVVTKIFVLRTDRTDEDVLCYDFVEGTWEEMKHSSFLRYLHSDKMRNNISEELEVHALWYLEQAEAFNGEGDDAAVEGFLAKWTAKKEEYREEWDNMKGAWTAKYVETTFFLKGKQYSITPEKIGLENYGWDAGFMEYIQGDIGKDLEELGATEIRHFGFLD